MDETGSSAAEVTKAPKYVPPATIAGYVGALSVLMVFILWAVLKPRHANASVAVLWAVVVLLLFALTRGVASRVYLNSVVKVRSPKLYEEVMAAQAAQRQARQAAARIAFENSPAEVARRAAAAYEENLRSGQLKPVAVPGLVLRPFENAYWSEPASVIVHTTKTQYVGGYGGVSVRVMRGVSVRSGSYHGEPVKQDVRVKEDQGTLNITDSRLLFIGASESKDIPFNKIASVQYFNDGVEVVPSNKKTIAFQTGSPHAGIVLERLLKHDIGPDNNNWSDLDAPKDVPNYLALKTSSSIVTLAAKQIREHLTTLRIEYDSLDKQIMVPATISVEEFAEWLHSKLAALRQIMTQVQQLVVTGLSQALSASTDDEAKVNIAHWLHECDDACYSMIGWERDVRRTSVPAQLEHVRDTMPGMTAHIFEEIQAIPDKLDELASGTSKEGTPLSLTSTFSGERLDALNQALKDSSKLGCHRET